jgi:hypothetical protein
MTSAGIFCNTRKPDLQIERFLSRGISTLKLRPGILRLAFMIDGRCEEITFAITSGGGRIGTM